MKKKIIMLACVCALTFIACQDKKESTSSALSSDEIGIRKTSVENENNVVLPDANFTTLQPGESNLIERSFENAPPLVPHSIEDMLPITRENNMCLSCHDKAIAADVGATAMPMTHYFDFQAGKATGDEVSNERFNCIQCHVPQSNAKPLVGNTFKPEFKSEEAKKRSNLIDALNEGVK
ncbi:nitrate reductase [Campylobacter sp. MIT 19-121]|uniref:nitrate reductase cytochrome c-type subunit n=1 Tax=Campylobacter sp. MIT 19-121 TaxID=2703906 RepID=UPI0013897957|nr:nitrate reductase cytochrome c-type subunit [Campylobacter sp. MIT 19-121]NDJ27893.1 nitrate reductase [Campylobacter sp. MIT 19-121]